jgi:hypothetical protein
MLDVNIVYMIARLQFISTVITRAIALILPHLLPLRFSQGLLKLLLVSRFLVKQTPILLCLGVLGRRLCAGPSRGTGCGLLDVWLHSRHCPVESQSEMTSKTRIYFLGADQREET